MPAINHAITIASANNAPNPSGTPMDTSEGAPGSPSPENPWQCGYICTVVGHIDTVLLLWDGASFSLPDSEANDPNFGEVALTYDPPLH